MASFRRKIFYVGGFDPRGVRFYHQLMREQVERLAARTGETITASTRRKASAIRTDWTIANASADVETELSFLRWEDIVRTAWISNPLTLARRAFAAYRGNLKHLDFRTGRTLGQGPLITLFYPPVLTLGLPLLIGLVLFGLSAILLPWLVALAIGVVGGIAIATPLLRRIHAPWLLRFFIFNAELGGGEADPAMEARLDAFADEVLAALDQRTPDQRWDEILLLSHSNGSILAVPLMARILTRTGGVLPAGFTLVTLGHCIPLVACRRDATRFHEQLRLLAAHDFRWIDIGSPPDGAAYFGVNPMLLVTPDPRPRMELLSPRFHLFYDPDTYHKGYANKYEIHFDYLRTGDRVSPIDLPSLMSTPRTVEQSVAAFRAI